LLCWVKVHWGFYKVLTIYQIYHTWTHHLHHSPFSSFSILGAVSSGLIFPFTYTCTQYLYHIHPPITFPHMFPLSLVPFSPRQDLFCLHNQCILINFKKVCNFDYALSLPKKLYDSFFIFQFPSCKALHMISLWS
jgi:hypothetical protein